MTRMMKDSGVEWIGEIPENWEVVKFKNIGTYINGYAFKPEDWTTAGKKIVRIQDLTGSNDNPNFYDGIIDEKYNITRGDYLISWAATLDAFIWDNDDAWLNQHIFKAIPKNNVTNKYFFWLIKESMQNMNNENKHGIMMQHVTLGVFNNFNIPLPPKNEQQKIAAFLDEKCRAIDEIISKTEQSIEEYKKLKQSVITKAVTKGIRPNRPMQDSNIAWIGEIPENWEIRKLKTIGDYRNGLTYSPEDICEKGQGILVLRSSNIKQGKLVLDNDDDVYVNIDVPNILKVQQGDILVCSRNGSRELIGKNAIIENDINASFGAFMMILRCNCHKYMYYILNSHIFSYYLGSFFTATINQLTGKNFGGMNIVYCPDTLEQQQIADYLDEKCAEIDTLIEKKQQFLAEMANYKKSLIYEYVTGKKEVA